MNAQFFGGPYDGLSLATAEVNRYGRVVSKRFKGQRVHFVLLPPLADWERVRAGEVDSAPKHPYELVKTGDNVAFHDADVNERFNEILRAPEEA
ncbi:hypothetical protein [Gemmata massiliana]|uniref:hypothetical protein n=1 Tax=Gemmata massiliana TaxID=1210884 RepID=UPI0013A68EDC|nr:hypothetical protein [Gemmata massiliana]